MGITITGIRAPRAPDTTQIIALFDVELEGLVHLRGCALVQKAGKRVIWGPPLPKNDTAKSGVAFSMPLRHAITEAASAAFDAFQQFQRSPSVEVSAAVDLVRQLEARDAA